jgi:hypothetical protein
LILLKKDKDLLSSLKLKSINTKKIENLPKSKEAKLKNLLQRYNGISVEIKQTSRTKPRAGKKAKQHRCNSLMLMTISMISPQQTD